MFDRIFKAGAHLRNFSTDEKNNFSETRKYFPWFCSTLLVLLNPGQAHHHQVPREISSPCGFGRYLSNQYFQHTEIQSQACTHLTKSRKRFGFKSGGLLIFGMQEEIQTLRKSTEQI